jgi:hypothetical protein
VQCCSVVLQYIRCENYFTESRENVGRNSSYLLLSGQTTSHHGPGLDKLDKRQGRAVLRTPGTAASRDQECGCSLRPHVRTDCSGGGGGVPVGGPPAVRSCWRGHPPPPGQTTSRHGPGPTRLDRRTDGDHDVLLRRRGRRRPRPASSHPSRARRSCLLARASRRTKSSSAYGRSALALLRARAVCIATGADLPPPTSAASQTGHGERAKRLGKAPRVAAVMTPKHGGLRSYTSSSCGGAGPSILTRPTRRRTR